MDGIDLWTSYGILIEKGSDTFLNIPERKTGIVNDWPDQSGLDLDLETPYFKERTIILSCGLIAVNENDFWNKYNLFITNLMKPGFRMFYVERFSRSFRLVYKKCSDFTTFTKFKSNGKIAAKFILEMVEPDPKSILTDANCNPITSGGQYIYG
jgi:hypothetical protein